jgi:hypothetical protein
MTSVQRLKPPFDSIPWIFEDQAKTWGGKTIYKSSLLR